ncbi:MAG TPA: choice-of-anchor Q domain-containing protein, partial [Vicinamibacteria bacterium]|nr:choice-of-anchor Q domain-containing protein [Vicinamibacteria bacterium]
ISNGANGNQIGTAVAPIDPLLGFLQDNGGLTFTHELLSGSPGLDAGIFVASVAVDQRGITRPQGSDPDVGSFELFVPTTVPEDLDLQYMSLDSQTYEACNSISAAPSVFVGSSAAVSFRAGSFVVLRNGFSVLSGGELVVVLLLPTGC